MRRLLALAIVTVPAVSSAGPRPQAVMANPAVLKDQVILARYGRAGISLDGMLPADSDHAKADTYFKTFRAAEETADHVRVLVEDDQARVLVWLDRTDLAWTVARPVRVLGTDDAGVWVLPGAPLTVSGDGDRVAIRTDDDDLAIDGTIARSALRHRFRAPTRAPRAATHNVGAIAGAPGGPPLLPLYHAMCVTVRDGGVPGWSLVEHQSARLRIVGWARTDDLFEGGMLTLGTGGGFGYGMSDTDRVTLDAGACMFDEQGAIVGVQLARGERYAGHLGGGRWSVYVGIPWGLHQVIVRDRNRGKGDPAWARCR